MRIDLFPAPRSRRMVRPTLEAIGGLSGANATPAHNHPTSRGGHRLHPWSRGGTRDALSETPQPPPPS